MSPKFDISSYRDLQIINPNFQIQNKGRLTIHQRSSFSKAPLPHYYVVIRHYVTFQESNGSTDLHADQVQIKPYTSPIEKSNLVGHMTHCYILLFTRPEVNSKK
jgi:hypothetical protein